MTKILQTVSPTHNTHASVGRADLLRLLSLWGKGAEHAAAGITGFEYREPVPLPAKSKPDNPRQAPPTVEDASPAPPRPQAMFYTASRIESDNNTLSNDYLQRLQPPTAPEANLPALRSTPPPAWVPLSPTRRLTVFAEKQLRRWQPVNQWDVNQLVRRVSAGLPPTTRKVRQQRLRWAGSAVVVHMAPQTEPLHDDYRALAQVVHRRSGGRIPIYLHYAGHGWLVYAPAASTQVQHLHHPWRDLPQAPLLAGLPGLAVGWPNVAQTWPSGWKPHALLAAAAQPTDLPEPGAGLPPRPLLPARAMPPVAVWDVDSHLKTLRQPPRSSLQCPQHQLAQLLALLSLAVAVHPALLRALRCLLGVPAAAELQAWRHPDVGCNSVAIAVRAERRSHHIEHLQTLPLALRQQAAECIEAHHTWLTPEIALEEAQLAHTHAPGSKVVRPEAHFRNIAFGLQASSPPGNASEIRAYLTRAGHRVDEATWEASPEFAQAWAAANADALVSAAGLPQSLPLHLLARLRAAAGGYASAQAHPQDVQIRQQDGLLYLDRCDTSARDSPAARPYGLIKQWINAGPLQWRSRQNPQWQRLDLNQSSCSIDPTGQTDIELTDGQATLAINLARRPAWALEWARDRKGLYALAPNPWGPPIRVPFPHFIESSAPNTVYLHMTGVMEPFPLRDCEVALALDDVGLRADLIFTVTQTQAFRYLPPGQFTMGSPAGEVSRYDDEGPQHQVTLTQGLWLADTACTQGLWQAVMGGKNPSHFMGDADLPVERVSWDDVQTFLARLQAFLPPGVEAVLPTEAEWEYACRAGGVPGTPFSFGDNINASQVNYDGNHPYKDAAKGEYISKTIAVKALPANAWGFFQMHGNVWEWCADALRPYTADAVADPCGATGKGIESFAVRGGSWYNLARIARSALRLLNERVRRSYELGFRFALRSKSQSGAGGPVLGGRSTSVLDDARDAPVGALSKSRKKRQP